MKCTKLFLTISLLLINVLSIFSQNDVTHPSEELYNHIWNITSAHPYKGLTIPDNYMINFVEYCMPTKNKIVTSKFGYRAKFKRQHKGVDIKVYIGDTIYAAFDGEVRVVKYDANGYGKYVVIRHYNGLETIYGHMSKQLVKVNQYINAGEPIGLGGNTGRSTGSHLHFEIRFCGEAIDPLLIFDFETQKLKKLFFIFKNNAKII
jgi:murein DD-endopeptidase MepM/ murein hydrolase activator NlpD